MLSQIYITIFNVVKKWLPGLFFCLFGAALPAQYLVEASVFDASDQQVLPFAWVRTVHPDAGTLSDLDGKFRLELPTTPDSVVVSLLGYAPAKFPGSAVPPQIFLTPSGVNLSTVQITSDQDPARRIIRNIIQNRRRNDYFRLPRFSYDSYNKVRMFADTTGLRPDTSRSDSLFAVSDLLVWESVSHLDFKAPGRRREEILASRLSGYPGRAIPLTPGDLQSMSLYSDQISVLGEALTSPFSKPGLKKYHYVIEDVFPQGRDTVYSIGFFPKDSSGAWLAGVTRIHSARWNIVSFDADLQTGPDALLISEGQIRQIFAETTDSIWFPVQLNTDLKLLQLNKSPGPGIMLSGRSYLSNISFVEGKRIRFSDEELIISSRAAALTDSLLPERRPLPLTEREQTAYERMDSLGKEIGLANIVDITLKLQQGRLMVGPVDLVINRLNTSNEIEWNRFGLGLSTNEKLSRRFEIRGFGGYGLRDKEWKYGGGGFLDPLGSRKWMAGGSWSRDLLESGYERLETRPNLALYQNFYQEYIGRLTRLYTMDYVEGYRVWIMGSPMRNLSLLTEFSRREYTPVSFHRFADLPSYPLEEVAVNLRYAPGEKFSRTDLFRFPLNLDFPVFRLRYRRGLVSDFGAFAYEQWAASFHYSFFTSNMTRLGFRVTAGYSEDLVPHAKLYPFRANGSNRAGSDVAWTFNTMQVSEFFADQYVAAWAFWRAPRSPFGQGDWRPKFSLLFGGAWGRLLPDPTRLRTGLRLQAPEKGYFEAGLLVQDIFPRPAKNPTLTSSLLARLGIGAYYRVGPYAKETFRENFAIRLTGALY